MQSGIQIGEDTISGTLKHVKDYVGYNETNPEEQEGNYLALSFSAVEGATIQTELVNGKNEELIDVTTDRFCVYRITNKNTQRIRVITTKGEQTETKEYDLSGLKLNKK